MSKPVRSYLLVLALAALVAGRIEAQGCGEFTSIPGGIRSINSDILNEDHGNLLAFTADETLSLLTLTRENNVPTLNVKFSLSVGTGTPKASFMNRMMILSRQKNVITDGVNLTTPPELTSVHLYSLSDGQLLNSLNSPFINTAGPASLYPFYDLKFPYGDWCRTVGKAGVSTSVGRVAVAGGYNQNILVLNGPAYTNEFCTPTAGGSGTLRQGMNPGVAVFDPEYLGIEEIGFSSLPFPSSEEIIEDRDQANMIRGFEFRGISGAAFDPVNSVYAAAFDTRFYGGREFGSILFLDGLGVTRGVGWSPIEGGGLGSAGSIAALGSMPDIGGVFAAGAPFPGTVESGFLDAISLTPTGIIRGDAGTVFFYSSSGEALRFHSGDTNGQEFGRSVAALGDITGDGYPEVAVGAPGTNQVFILSLTRDDSQILFTLSGTDRFGETVGSASTGLDGTADILAVGTAGGMKLFNLKECADKNGITSKSRLAQHINNAHKLTAAIRMMSQGDTLDALLDVYPDVEQAFTNGKSGMEGAWDAYPELLEVINQINSSIIANPDSITNGIFHRDTLNAIFAQYTGLGEAFAGASTKLNSVRKEIRSLNKQLKKTSGARQRQIRRKIAGLEKQRQKLSRAVDGYYVRRFFRKRLIEGYKQKFSAKSAALMAELQAMSTDLS